MQKPPVIILAAGSNSRFFPFNSSTHKGGLSLHGQTFLDRTLANLKEHDFTEIVLVISPRDEEKGGLKEAVEKSNSSLKLNLKFAVQPEAKGMGNALLRGTESLSGTGQSQFAIISPYQLTAGEMLDQMMKLGESCLCTSETSNPSAYGIIHLNAAGLVDGIVEKPAVGNEPSNQKVLTVYLLSADFLARLKESPAEEYNFETVLNAMVQERPVPHLVFDKPLPTLKYPWDLFKFQDFFFASQKSFVSKTAQLSETAVIDESAGNVFIDDGATIGHSSRIVGPCYIGKEVQIGDFCLVRESSIEAGAKIGAHSEIARSIFMASSTIHRGYVGDSIIGAGTKLGAGFLTANKRFDRKAIPVEVKGKIVDSGRRALGTFIGDHTQVGTRVNTMPGVCIGSEVTIFPDSIIYRNIPNKATINPAVQEEKK